MAIVQISKIIHRTGSVSELPQLDIGEIGFASDEQRLFIGNDPAWVPPDGNLPTNTEILTNSPNCRIDFSQGSGSLEIPVNRVKITGGSDGQILLTDGTGNLSWASVSGGISTYGNSNVASFLSTNTGNISANIVTATSFSGDGSSLTGLTGPAFIASITSGETLTSSPNGVTSVSIKFNNVEKNINSGYNASTGVFTATKEGFYQVNAGFAPGIPNGVDLSSNWGAASLSILKNNNPVVAGQFVEAKVKTIGTTTITIFDASTASSLIYLESGDTLACNVNYATDVSTFTTYANLVKNYFQAVWIRP